MITITSTATSMLMVCRCHTQYAGVNSNNDEKILNMITTTKIVMNRVTNHF